MMRLMYSRKTTTGFLAVLAATWAFLVVFIGLGVISLLPGCAVTPPKPEVRTETVTILVPTPVACIDKQSIPQRPPMVKVDPATATTEQLAAALVLDVYHYDLYVVVTEQILVSCATGVQK